MNGRPVWAVVGVVVVAALLLMGLAGTIGWSIGNNSKTAAEAPAGHSGGADLTVTEIGDPAVGRTLIVSKGCTDCHAYEGAGGEDAPALDFMKGHLSATEVANMSGRIWNHLPSMLGHFKEEGIPVPTFQGDEMANLIAYLHSGQGGPPEVSESGMMESGMTETGEETTTSG